MRVAKDKMDSKNFYAFKIDVFNKGQVPTNKASVPTLHCTFISGHVNNSYCLALRFGLF